VDRNKYINNSKKEGKKQEFGEVEYQITNILIAGR
jgi:hypothetical protein